MATEPPHPEPADAGSPPVTAAQAVERDLPAKRTDSRPRTRTDTPQRILFDVTHPAHVHLFRHAIRELVARGHVVAITSREKDVTTDLLDAYQLPHRPLSTRGDGLLALGAEWCQREVRLFRVARRFDPDVIVSRLNPAAAHVSALLGCRSVVFHDTELAGGLARVTLPFVDVICTPERFDGSYPGRQVRYPGYHELAYLHPSRFTPDPDRLAALGIDVDEPYSVIRLVSTRSHHDLGAEGVSPQLARDLVSRLAAHGDVHITSEVPLAPDLERYRTTVPPEAIHDLLAFADLFVGDSGTMAAEAAVLGTPTVRLAPHARSLSNITELEDYGLLRNARDGEELLDTVDDLLSTPDLSETWHRRRARLLEDKIDVTDFLVDVVVGDDPGRSRSRGDDR
jgi:predicted glycosyltransferase